MFQIEPVLWLQSLESPFLTWLMSTVSLLGYTPVYASMLIVLIFGVNLKRSLFVFLTILVCGLLTYALKNGLQFPRPSDVDARVVEPGHERPPLLVDKGGATSFWALPSSEAMAAAKAQTDWSYGLPSGHVSLAAAFFFGLAFFFRSKGVLVFSVCWVLLMALSRMYLGRHFIADVLGGIAVGTLAVSITAFLVRPLLGNDAKSGNLSALMRWGLFAIVLVVLAPFIELIDKEDVGRMVGLLLTNVLLLRFGFPPDKAKLWKRVGRIVLAILVYIVIERLIDPLLDSMGLEDNSFGTLVAVCLITFSSFYGTILIARRLKLYETA